MTVQLRNTLRLAVGFCAVLTARCSCNEELRLGTRVRAQIDVCVRPSPGAELTCYEAQKALQRDELCAGGDTCRRPTLSLDVGDVPSGLGTNAEIVVRSIGELALRVHVPTEDNGADPNDLFRLERGSGETADVIELPQGTEHTFSVRVRGAPCGKHSTRMRISSNDGVLETGTSDGAELNDSPVIIDMQANVAGACVCPQADGLIDFGAVPLGRKDVRRFTIESCGDAPLTITNATIGVDASQHYAVEGLTLPDPTTQVLQPGQVGHIDVSYAPLVLNPTGGVDAAQLWIDTDSATAQPHYMVILIGRAVEPPRCRLEAFPFDTTFGRVATSEVRDVKLQNVGDDTCRLFDLQRITGSADFQVTSGAVPPEVTIPPGASHAMQFTFTPSVTGFQTATFQASADDATGTFETVDLVMSGNPEAPDGSTCFLDVQPNYIDFEEVSVGGTKSLSITITNLAEDMGFPLCQITSAEITQGAPDFRGGDTGIMAAFVIPPGQTTTATITFEPQSEGFKNGVLTVRSPGGDFDIPLFGTALGSALCVDVDGVIPASTVCTSSQPCDTLNFGTVSPGANVTREVTLTSCGAGELTIRGLQLDPATSAAYALTAPAPGAPPRTLAPGQSMTLTLRYGPNATTGDFGALDVLSTATPNRARINIRGNYTGDCTRILRCSPTDLAFGSLETGTIEIRTARCSNFGTEPLTINNVSLAGPGELDVAGSTYATLNSGDSLPVQIACSPTSAGALSGSTDVSSTACDGAPMTIGVSCNGIDPPLPACIGSSTYSPVEKWRWTGSASHPGYDDVWVTPVVINLTDDNADGFIDALDTPDIVFTALNSVPPIEATSEEEFCKANDPEPAIVVALDGGTGATLWEWGTLPPSNDPAGPSNAVESESNLAVGDIDADGMPEIIAVKYTFIGATPGCEPNDTNCCLNGKYRHGSLVAIEHDGVFKWESERWHLPDSVGENASAPILGDMNGDGFPEIALGNAVFDHDGLLLFEGNTGTTSTPGHGEGSAGHGAFVGMADLNGDGTNELIAGSTAFNYDGNVVWDRGDAADGLVTVADLDADPQPELIIFGGNNEVTILEHDGSVKIASTWVDGGVYDEETGESEGYISPNPAVGDVDGDGWPEIVIAATALLYVFEHDMTPKWSAEIYDGSGMSGPTTFDFEGDGQAEVLYADETTVRIFDGISGAVKYSADRGSRTIADNPVVADVDNDGHADIILAMETPLGDIGMHGVIVYSNVDNNWVSTRRVWNQHAYHISNVSESGVIPAREGAGWLSQNVYRSNAARCE